VVFARWYGPKGDPVYIERALKALASEYFIKILDNKKFEAYRKVKRCGELPSK
jgi:hypothetical protein